MNELLFLMTVNNFLGCRVVGFAGTDEKWHYLTEDLGFDQVYNYKKGTHNHEIRLSKSDRFSLLKDF